MIISRWSHFIDKQDGQGIISKMSQDHEGSAGSYRLGILGFGNVARTFVEHYHALAPTIVREYGFDLRISFACDAQSVAAGGALPLPNLLEKKKKDGRVGKAWKDPLQECERLLRADCCDVLLDTLPSSRAEAGPTHPLLKTALEHGIHVVTANKSPLVFKGAELLACARVNRAYLGVSGATAGCLPTSGVLTRELAGSDIVKIRGILNGTSNHVLDCVMYQAMTMEDAIAQAVDMGIAEPDFTFDLDGIDTAFKMIILALLLTGKNIAPSEVPCTGIQGLASEAIQKAARQGRVTRLIATLVRARDRVQITVAPEQLGEGDPLARVRGTGKGIMYFTRHMGELTIIGGSSGRRNIAATLLKEIINVITR